MTWLPAGAHDALLCDESRRLGELLWHLLKAEQTRERLSYRKDENGTTRTTAFGEEVGRDPIQWWIFTKEDDLDVLRARTEEALVSTDRLKEASARLKDNRPDTYDALIVILRQFAEKHSDDVDQILGYVRWLWSRNQLAPCILFTYRVWGSTRRGDRRVEVSGDTPVGETAETLNSLTEAALGVRNGGVRLYAFDRAYLEIGDEMYEADPEREGPIDVPLEYVATRASRRVLDEHAVFFELIRQSLRNVLLDIEKCVDQRNLLHSDAFWRRFILAAVNNPKTETQLWDFKETLTLWHAKAEAKSKAKTTFAEEVASFANAEGGVLIVGVTDSRQVVGIGTGHELETRLKVARAVLAERLIYPRDIVVFHQLIVPTSAGGDVACLVVAVAKSMEDVGVNDGEGRFTYPVRRETGLSRELRRDIHGAKIHFKSDSFDFIERLDRFVRENRID